MWRMGISPGVLEELVMQILHFGRQVELFSRGSGVFLAFGSLHSGLFGRSVLVLFVLGWNDLDDFFWKLDDGAASAFTLGCIFDPLQRARVDRLAETFRT